MVGRRPDTVRPMTFPKSLDDKPTAGRVEWFHGVVDRDGSGRPAAHAETA